jgi:DNA-directed RNA polymerase beta subunit
MRTKRSSPNLVTTGMDEAIPYMTSNFFSYKFRGKKGKVISVSDRFIVYEDTETKERGFVDLEEKTMKNSDGGFYVTLKLKPNVKKGQILNNNDILAYDPTCYSKQVGNEDGNGVSYNVGTMAKIAIMTTDEAFNDSTVITNTLSESMSSDYCVEKARYLPKDTNIYHLVQKGMEIQEGEPLMIFQNAFEEKDANTLLNSITDADVEAVSDLGRIHVRSKLTGVVQDIKIFRTCELDELSPSLRKLVTAYENRIKKEKAELKKMGVQNVEGLLDPDYKLEAQGKLKDCLDGVKIFVYIKCHDSMGVGDKLTYWSANKGVVHDIIDSKVAPYTDYRPDEEISAFTGIASINKRQIASNLLIGALNKLCIELARSCREKLGIPYYDNELDL